MTSLAYPDNRQSHIRKVFAEMYQVTWVVNYSASITGLNGHLHIYQVVGEVYPAMSTIKVPAEAPEYEEEEILMGQLLCDLTTRDIKILTRFEPEEFCLRAIEIQIATDDAKIVTKLLFLHHPSRFGSLLKATSIARKQ